jgi:hypothetical protein
LRNLNSSSTTPSADQDTIAAPFMMSHQARRKLCGGEEKVVMDYATTFKGDPRFAVV